MSRVDCLGFRSKCVSPRGRFRSHLSAQAWPCCLLWTRKSACYEKEMGSQYQLGGLNDSELVTGLSDLVRRGNALTAEVLAHLAELEVPDDSSGARLSVGVRILRAGARLE